MKCIKCRNTMKRININNNYYYQCNRCHTTVGKVTVDNSKDNSDDTHDSSVSSSDEQ